MSWLAILRRKAGGVPHSSCLSDGKATQTTQGTRESMDISKIRGSFERVRVAHHRGIHRYPLADNRSVRGDPPNPRQMQTGCEEAWGNTATLVVGTKDELGRRRSNWIGQVMALAFGTNTSARDCHALTLGEESGGCKTTD